MNSAAVVIQYEGYVGHNPSNHLVKELCVYGEEEGLIMHNVYKLPYGLNYQTFDQKIINKWLFENRHGLDWNDGLCRYSRQVGNLIMWGLEHRPIFTKGKNSVKQLSHWFPSVQIYNLEDFGCKTKISKLTNHLHPCEHHLKFNKHTHIMCAKKKAEALMSWINVHL